MGQNEAVWGIHVELWVREAGLVRDPAQVRGEVRRDHSTHCHPCPPQLVLITQSCPATLPVPEQSCEFMQEEEVRNK